MKSGRKNSDSSTVMDGRKQSLDTTAMAFGQDEEIKDSVLIDDDSRFIHDHKDNRALIPSSSGGV